MSIELRHLRYFLAVADELHFGRAAERLGMSQPPLSQQIRQLEQDIGAQLLVRTSRRVELTEAGRLLREHAQDILQRLDQATLAVRRAQQGQSGELRIGLTRATPLSPDIPRAIFAYRQQFPDVHLQLAEMNSLQQIDALVERELHVGFLRRRTLPAALASQRLFHDPLSLVLRADHPALKRRRGRSPGPVALKDFADEPFVAFKRDVGAGIHDDVIVLCRSAGFSPRIVQEAGEASTIISLVASGLGMSILPASCSQMHIDGACFVPLSDRQASSEIHLAWRRDGQTPLLRHFIRLLRDASAARAGG